MYFAILSKQNVLVTVPLHTCFEKTTAFGSCVYRFTCVSEGRGRDNGFTRMLPCPRHVIRAPRRVVPIRTVNDELRHWEQPRHLTVPQTFYEARITYRAAKEERSWVKDVIEGLPTSNTIYTSRNCIIKRKKWI